MPTDPRTIRSHTFATEGPTPPVMRTAELAAQATGQPQAVHSHPHGTACWPAEDPGGVCLLVLPDLSREVLVPARPDVSAPTLHAPVLADGMTVVNEPGFPLTTSADVPVVDPTNWPDLGEVLDPGGYSADPPSSHPVLLEALAEALWATSVPSRYEQTADEIGPGRTSEERHAAAMARFTEWAGAILRHPSVVPLVGNWRAGYDSGLGEGRKASSTAAMLGVFRVFDPRPLGALVAAHDASGLPLTHDAALDLLAAVRQVLDDAEVGR